MAFKINDSCVSCGLCASNCPVDAIKEGDPHYFIDESACVSCGLCASNCPVEAIIED